MFTRARVFGLLLTGMLCALALGIATLGSGSQAASAAPVQQTCDTSGTKDGSADPTIVLPSHEVTFTAWNFSAGENVSFWFTNPSGQVQGTAQPLCCAASDGYVRFQPVSFTDLAYQTQGRWALTVQGQASNHASVIYFCLYRQVQQATATSVPATSTTAPPSATSAPATSTTAATEVSTSVSTPAATEVATSAATATATTAATTAPTEVPTEIPTTAPTEIPTSAPTTAPPTPIAVVPSPTSTVVGMPRTGSADTTPLLILGLLAFGLLGAGLLVRRNLPGSRR